MVGVAKLEGSEHTTRNKGTRTYGAGDDIPGKIPLQMLNVNENTLQLDNSKRGMSIVELDGNLIGEFDPRAARLLEASNDVVERRSNPEILLLQAEFLAALKVVVGIQNGADSLSSLLIGD